MPEAEVEALYALRGAFAHDYSLYNVNHKRPSRMHRFAVGVGGSMTPAILPKMPWDGDMANKTSNNVTTVKLEAFGDLVEDICTQLFALDNSDELDVVLAGGTDEVLHRYRIFTAQDPSRRLRRTELVEAS